MVPVAYRLAIQPVGHSSPCYGGEMFIAKVGLQKDAVQPLPLFVNLFL
jgi:hypothetical protein